MTKEEKKYYRKLRKYRTSLLRFVWLIITKKIPMKLAIQIYQNPIEIMFHEGDIKKEELLTTFAGLRIIQVFPDGKNKYRIFFGKSEISWTKIKIKKT